MNAINDLLKVPEQTSPLTLRQRWSHYLVLIFALVGFIIGSNLRDTVLKATTMHSDDEAGIRAQYPEDWLIDTEGDYVFRVRDASQPGFKTTIQVAVRPVSSNTQPRNVLDALSLSRAQSLAAYSVLSQEPFLLPGEGEATAMHYTFVSTEANPFLQSIPRVVSGLDILTIKRGQSIIITFLSDATTFDQNLPIFEQFINDLEF